MNIFIDNGTRGFKLKQSFTSSTNEGPNNWLAADLNNNLRPDVARLSSNIHSGSFLTWENDGGVRSSPIAGKSPTSGNRKSAKTFYHKGHKGTQRKENWYPVIW